MAAVLKLSPPKHHSLYKKTENGYELLYSTMLPPLLPLRFNPAAVGDHQQRGGLSVFARSLPSRSRGFASQVCRCVTREAANTVAPTAKLPPQPGKATAFLFNQ